MPSTEEKIDVSGAITGIHTETIPENEPFIDFAARFSSMPGSVILMSGGERDCAEYHIMGAMPWLTLSGRRRKMSIKIDRREMRFEADPFETLRAVTSKFRIECFESEPFRAGVMGYLAYDLKNSLENLPKTSLNDLDLPDILFFAPSIVAVHQISENRTRIHAPILDVPGFIENGYDKMRACVDEFKRILSGDSFKEKGFSDAGSGFKSNFARQDYLKAVKKIKNYIAAGHVYQANMSQRFEADFAGDGFSLFRSLFKINPAPFFAYMNGGDHQVISTSPERFIKRNGNRIETRPIKGTRPRGKTPAEDKRLKIELEKNEKDDAELSMIVDLLRNDIGKVCSAGSVKVLEHKRLEAYHNVFHLVSIIEGRLDEKYDSVDILKATFPGGSITGCPKIRSMEIIDELEPNERHIYTGSIGYASFHETMDFSVAIRTATLVNDKIIFSVGGGVVWDSDPRDEYDETLHKGKTFMEAFKKKSERSPHDSWLWINGSLRQTSRASVSVGDHGFLFGYGFFETMKAVYGVLENFDAHIRRFTGAWAEFFPDNSPPDLSWDIIIDRVIKKNRLENRTAAIKIIAAKGKREFAPLDHTLVVSARPYVHRLELIGKPGLDLLAYPEARHTPLAVHKTLNRMYYVMAEKWAFKNGADEALILNPDRTVSETNSGNILLLKDRRVIRPKSPFSLPGTMEMEVLDNFEKNNFKIETRPVKTGEILKADHVLVTNSLIGAVPALSPDGKRLKRLREIPFLKYDGKQFINRLQNRRNS